MRSKDRLPELAQRAADADAAAAQTGGRGGGRGADTPPAGGGDADDALAARDLLVREVLREAEEMRARIHELSGNTQLMRRLLADPTFHTNRQLQEQLEAVAARSTALGVQLCRALRDAGGGAAPVAGAGVAARVTRLQRAATRRLLEGALGAHHAQLHAARDQRRDLLRDHIRLTNLSLSDDECEALLDTDNVALFVGNVRAETAAARRELREAEARHAELLRLEAGLREVRDLFAQLAFLVAQQQDQLDTVEFYALQATEHVEGGGRHLLKGTLSRKKARNKKLGLIVCLVSGFLVVFLILLYT